MTIKNFYTATYVQPGDVFVAAVKVMVQYDGTYRVYRCEWPHDNEPQGAQMGDEMTTIEEIFPIIRNWKALEGAERQQGGDE